MLQLISNSSFFMKIAEGIEHEEISLKHGERLLVEKKHVVVADGKVQHLYHKKEGLEVPEYQLIQDFENFFLEGKEKMIKIYRFNKETLFSYLEDNNLLNLYFLKEVDYFNGFMNK
ncbi:hypothetical protein HCA93_14825 [Listeria innocua]|uniref:hypothetical protein n=1 Tax=Listeria innocua TaxID=1642 RepID=UPI0016275CAC|nr:hypothetical protein [Listeria innocua]MBC2137566.1 hypothetical protein [Listeria innocua]MBC2140591.1 hypothetical protein [Listeria innocua]